MMHRRTGWWGALALAVGGLLVMAVPAHASGAGGLRSGGHPAPACAPQCHNAKLANADLSWVDLRWVDLSAADLSHAKLRHARLAWADLIEADLTGADLFMADLSNARLLRANLTDAALDLARLDNAWLAHITWHNAVCPHGGRGPYPCTH